MEIYLKRKKLLKSYLNLMTIESLEKMINDILIDKKRDYLQTEEFKDEVALMDIEKSHVGLVLDSIFVVETWKCLKKGWVPLAYILEKHEIHKGNNHRYFDTFMGPKERVGRLWFVKETEFMAYLDEHFELIK